MKNTFSYTMTVYTVVLNSYLLHTLKTMMSGTLCPKGQNKVRILMWSSIDIAGLLLYFKIYFAKLCFSMCFRFCFTPRSIPHGACLNVHNSVIIQWKDTCLFST